MQPAGPHPPAADRRPPPAPPLRDMALVTKQRAARRRKGCVVLALVALIACLAPLIAYRTLASPSYSDRPVQVKGLSGITAIAAGSGFSLALRDDGSVWAWGTGLLGVLGNDSDQSQRTPVRVSLPRRAIAIAATWQNGAAVTDDGKVWVWGSGELLADSPGATKPYYAPGRFGWPTPTPQPYRPAPAPLPSLSNVTSLAGGAHLLVALTTTGEVWSWRVGTSQPKQENLPRPATAIGVGRATYQGWASALLDGDDEPLARLDDGRLRVGATNYTFDGNATTGAGVARMRFAITADGAVWFWGWGYGTEMCTANHGVIQYQSPCSHAPVKLPGLTSITAVAPRTAIRTRETRLFKNRDWDTSRTDRSWTDGTKPYNDAALLALAADGELWYWDSGRTAGGNTVTAKPLGFGNVRAIATSERHYLALRNDGTVWAWGFNDLGQLGR